MDFCTCREFTHLMGVTCEFCTGQAAANKTETSEQPTTLVGNYDLSIKAVTKSATEKYISKLFPCEPPCDSYGICDNCSEANLIMAGANLALKHLLPAIKDFTCFGCSQEPVCKLAWDMYNTNGDCLAEK